MWRATVGACRALEVRRSAKEVHSACESAYVQNQFYLQARGRETRPMKTLHNRSALRPADDDATMARVRAIATGLQHLPGALLPVLHAVQDALGHVPAAAVPVIAQVLNLSRAEVHGVVTYYHHFRSAPAGRHVVQVCQAESCKACGADGLMAHAQEALGCDGPGTRADGAVTLEAVYCLGLCASSPAIKVDDRLHARMTPTKMDQLVAALEVSA